MGYIFGHVIFRGTKISFFKVIIAQTNITSSAQQTKKICMHNLHHMDYGMDCIKSMHTNLGGGHMHAAPGLLAKEVVEVEGEEV